MKTYFSRDFQGVGPPQSFYLPAPGYRPGSVKGLSQELFPELPLTGNILLLVVYLFICLFI